MLNNNDLAGDIPDSLGALQGLKSISLANNQLTGRVPQGLNYLRGDPNVYANFAANEPTLCGAGFTGLLVRLCYLAFSSPVFLQHYAC